ncbi:uncharacterized protein B0H64DRAFT_29406 [Chaetomium fimeti]|uniref:F-box domain-containing protein n=1 Tax=Chaetomium fimeti TaxID=1854472 RepID=A0AAE0HRF3_9PEZI|nr:hypothetical protein B0H64DRAFT_29406 [Chaetomium fimeti]
MNPQESNPDLESFRTQWKAEVQAKQSLAGPSTHQTPQTRTAPPPRTKLPSAQNDDDSDDDGYAQPQQFDHAEAGPSTSSVQTGHPEGPERGDPVSALEHYEKAVERETVGKLGDSLQLYRKAFRLDDGVDQKYRAKHFPKPPPKPARAPSANAAPGTVTTGAASAAVVQPPSTKDLIASFAVMSIAPAPPPVEGMPPPPCPLAELPEEILVLILRDVAVLDVGDFMRLAQVCKRLAYLVATESTIWRRLCLGTEFGFGGMHYYWQQRVCWDPFTDADLIREAAEGEAPPLALADPAASGSVAASPPSALTLAERADRQARESKANTLAFYRSVYSASWQRMFRMRPRIRFNGCYISTVNYLRSGQASHNQSTWGTPVHIVTYYRYLRFYRDGSVISLLSTTEPAEVVHHLTRDALALHAGGAGSNLPSAVMRQALRGRWRLARESDNPEALPADIEGDVTVETEGVSKYIYRMDLELGTAGKITRNNKLGWKGFYSYNPLTDDWAEFTMRHSKPFFFSRVKSYGVQGA